MIHYICSYAEPSRLNEYRITPSGSAKIDYIKSVLKSMGYSLSVFSPVCINSKKICFKNRENIVIDDSENIIYPFSMGGSNIFVISLSYFLIYIQLMFYIARNVRHNDVVILYHSNNITFLLKWIKKIFRFRLILEIEEIYNAVYHNKLRIKKEIELVSTATSEYILVNNIMADKLNISNYYVVCEGQYMPLTNTSRRMVGDNGKVNILYAGFIEEDSDVFLAVRMAELLSEKYMLHIAGYGSEESIDKLKKEIERHNTIANKCFIRFYGCLYGDEYEQLISECSIGLCSRILEDDLSDYTFPSKVIAYLARNLKVVCTPITCVRNSSLAQLIEFSDDISPKSMVKVIERIAIDECIDNGPLLFREHYRFMSQMHSLIENNNNT